MTVRELDDIIQATLEQGPCTAAVIYARCGVPARCTVHDLMTALRAWVARGLATKSDAGMWSLAADFALPSQSLRREHDALPIRVSPRRPA